MFTVEQNNDLFSEYIGLYPLKLHRVYQVTHFSADHSLSIQRKPFTDMVCHCICREYT